MRTTLELDDAVLRSARALAAQTGSSLGAAVSELARRGLDAGVDLVGEGFPLLPSAGAAHLITDDLVVDHRDDTA